MNDFDWSKLRIGLGHDTHRLGEGGPLRLGGITIPHERHAIGHSDADVLLHAITDAILGAAGLGDIGEFFPNNLDENRDRDSVEMLRLAMAKVVEAGFSIINLDCVVFAQSPRLSPHKSAIKDQIATALSISPDQVGLKGKTGEGVDAVGHEQALKAQCVALLVRA